MFFWFLEYFFEFWRCIVCKGRFRKDTLEIMNDIHEVNRQLRMDYLQACAELKKEGSDVAAAEARIVEISQRFVEENRRLAFAHARGLLRSDASEDIGAAAMWGLWEAFVGSDPELVREVVVGEDGVVRGVQGWDPARGTFGTWCKQHIYGRARRAVVLFEAGYENMSYAVFQQVPRIKAEAERMVEAGGDVDRDAIATKLGLTRNVVDRALSPAPVRLESRVGSSDQHFEDVIGVWDGEGEDGTSGGEVLGSLADRVSVDELVVLAAVTGVHGGDRMNVGRVSSVFGIPASVCSAMVSRGRTKLAK